MKTRKEIEEESMKESREIYLNREQYENDFHHNKIKNEDYVCIEQVIDEEYTCEYHSCFCKKVKKLKKLLKTFDNEFECFDGPLEDNEFDVYDFVWEIDYLNRQIQLYFYLYLELFKGNYSSFENELFVLTYQELFNKYMKKD